MANLINLTAQPRDLNVKAGTLRRAQLVPGVMYGRDFAPKALQFEYLPLHRAVIKASTSQLISLAVEGEAEPHKVLVREVQHDAITGRIIHIDLYRTQACVAIRSEVPIVQRGQLREGLRNFMVAQLIPTLEIECTPENMPAAVEVDLGALEGLHSHISVSDLNIPEGVTVLTPMNADVLRLVVPHGPAAEEEAAAAAPAAAGAEAPKAAS